MWNYTLSYFNFNKNQWISFEKYSIMFTGKNGCGLPMEQGEFNYQTHLSYGSGTDSCEPSHVCNLRYLSPDTVKVAEKFECKLIELEDVHCIKLSITYDKPFNLRKYLIKLTDRLSLSSITSIRAYFFELGDYYWSVNKLVKKVNLFNITRKDIYFGISVELLDKHSEDLSFSILIALDVEHGK